ncbi:hypothetical protein [Paracoccus xiamenensis]|uniref:hypothetical protein n=1 Tax=Paracoccus xiamenensis TaxID=2714901 RepID=UPI00140D9834|nr:hypothetical protein [Paracoccus xiamenensis]NHF74074.1 hypothetical protein [Paracoccus xiamenensis]
MENRLNIVLGGHAENAMIRRFDETVMPERNISQHPYYVALNRFVDPPSFGCADTFLAISAATLVPSADWNMPYGNDYGSFKVADFGIRDSRPDGHSDIRQFAGLLLQNNALSPTSLARAGRLDFAHYPPELQAELAKDHSDYVENARLMYLDRLLSQVETAQREQAKLVLPEADIAVLKDVVSFVARTFCPAPIDLPDMTGIDPLRYEPIGALIRFQATDADELLAVRKDRTVADYSKQIGEILSSAPSKDAERQLLQAMAGACQRRQGDLKARRAYEIGGWLLRPLHYIPVISQAITVAEDIRDLLLSWVTGHQKKRNDWYLIGTRMHEVSTEDYLRSKHNQL